MKGHGGKSVMTDKELLKKLKKDKSSGLSLAVDLYSGLMYKIAAAVLMPVGSKEDVEECVSDSFLAFYGEIDNINPERASIKTYLAVITRRKAIDLYRKLKKASALIGTEEADTEAVSGDFAPGYDRRVAVISAIKALGEPDSTIITRKFYLGEKASEIAAAVGMSEDAVQKRIERSRKKLQAELGGVLNG